MRSDDTPSTKTVKLLLKLLAAPRRLTKMQLAVHIGVKDRSSVTDHLRHLGAAGIEVKYDEHNRYYVLPNQGFKELNYLAPLNDRDKQRIEQALRQFSSAEALQLSNKLERLYDFQALGIEALRRPELEKVNAAEEAMKAKRRAVLVNYRSRNSNSERDRKVEIFDLRTDINMVLAYDCEKLRPSFFKLSRTDRVAVLDEPWMYGAQHHNKVSDCFNIVDNQQIHVDLTLKVSAYNDLVEAHPAARQHIRKGATEETYVFSARVNQKFIGLRQFILANWRHVEIHAPDSLREEIVNEARVMLEQLSGT